MAKVSLKERQFKLLCSSDFNLDITTVCGWKKKLKLDSYEDTYYALTERYKLLEEAKEFFVDIEPRELAKASNTSTQNAKFFLRTLYVTTHPREDTLANAVKYMECMKGGEID